jgi:uncharacterized membrane protein YeaQ/YmgE (transglycosylase-associated protein family)
MLVRRLPTLIRSPVEAERTVMEIILGMPAAVIAEAIVLANDPGGHIATIMGIVGVLLGGCLGGVLYCATPADDL